MAIVIIGASGMLMEATERLLESGEEIIVCSREIEKYDKLFRNFENLHYSYLDFSNINDYINLLSFIEDEDFSVESIIAWIHSPYYKLFEAFISKMSNNKLDIFLCRGTVKKDLNKNSIDTTKLYYIDLGYNAKENRWFNNKEISQAVLESYYRKQSIYLGIQ